LLLTKVRRLSRVGGLSLAAKACSIADYTKVCLLEIGRFMLEVDVD